MKKGFLNTWDSLRRSKTGMVGLILVLAADKVAKALGEEGLI